MRLTNDEPNWQQPFIDAVIISRQATYVYAKSTIRVARPAASFHLAGCRASSLDRWRERRDEGLDCLMP